MTEPDPLQLTAEVCRIFTELKIRFLVSGSVASSIYGEPRSTNDIDIVADISPEMIPSILDAFAEEYYIDDEDLRRAISESSSLNIIHQPTVQKVDIFIAGEDEHASEELDRARTVELGSSITLRVISPEDLILRKLLWYEKGNRVSDRQWLDVIGLLKTQGGELDEAYLTTWARGLGVTDLMVRAVGEAGR